MDPPRDVVRSARIGSALVLTLDNPPVNVLSRTVLDALSTRLDEAESDPDVRVVVLASAAEKAFAAGANIHEMAPMGPSEARAHGTRGQAITRKLERLPLPVIAAVHGVCFGGGCEIVLACDFVVASTDAQFGQPEINLGVMPGWGGTQRLPRRIGAARARRWVLTGRPVTAEAAEAAGLVDRVVPKSELLASSLALAEELAAKPPLALAAAKYALLRGIDDGIDRGLAYEVDLWARLFGTEGQREGMSAFLTKRPLAVPSRARWDEISAGFPWSKDLPASESSGKRKNSEGSGRD
jgi:enoyl-CoA hydratase